MKNIMFSPPDITNDEIEEVVAALKSGWITTGPRTKELERRIALEIGVSKAVCLNSATAAMELSLMFLGVGPGDEVITSAYTYSASAAVIHHVGAKVILVDTQPNSYEMDYELLRGSITEKTKVIIPVDIAGVMCNYEMLNQIVNEKRSMFQAKNDRQFSIGRITILSDAAHSFGASRNGKKAGLCADITCFSFHAVKNLTTAEGGAIVWNTNFGIGDDEMYREYMLLSLHGQSKDALLKTKKGSWEYDIIYPGYKCNLTDVLASIGLAQLKRYNGLLSRRFEIIRLYNKLLDKDKFHILQHEGSNFKSSGHLLLVRVNGFSEQERNNLIMKLADDGIATNVHYKPLPMFTAYMKLGFNIANYPNAFDLYKNEITLPLHTLLSDDDVHYICDKMNESLLI